MLRKAEWDGVDIKPYISGLLGEYISEEEMIYETSLEAYNTLFGGLRARRHLSAIASPPEVGKSYVMAQFAIDMAAKYGLNTLIIDTEGGFEPDWLPLIAERAGIEINVQFIDWRVKVDTKTAGKGQDSSQRVFPEFDYTKFKIKKSDKPTIYIYDARHIVQVMPFFGRPLAYKIKGGVIEPIEAGNMTSIWDSPIGKVIEGGNIGFVVLDSLSSPIESFFTGGQINYRTRAKTTQALLARGQDIIDEFKIVVMVTAHATIQHNNPHADPSIVGGKAVLHNIKFAAYMDKYAGKSIAKKAKVDWRNLRVMQIYRHTMKTPWREKTYLMTTGAGVIDFDRTPYLKKKEEYGQMAAAILTKKAKKSIIKKEIQLPWPLTRDF